MKPIRSGSERCTHRNCNQGIKKSLTSMARPELSIVIPVFNEEAVIPALVERLRGIADCISPLVIEIILMDDHSSDRSGEMLKDVSGQDTRFRYARLAKNSGSHIAILAGL